MATKYRQFSITLTTLGPLHIGSGEELTSTGEYLKTNDHVYFLRHNDLMEKLKADDRFDDYVQKILAHKQGFDFYQTLKDWGIKPVEMAERTIRLHQSGLNPASNNILHLHIKTNGEAYIPGSSIKGLLRTAILVKYLKDHPTELRNIESEIQTSLASKNTLHSVKTYWEKKERDLLPLQVFHAIRPYDSATVADDKLVVEQVSRQRFSKETSEVSEELDWLVECIANEVTLPFDLTILPDFDDSDFQYLKASNPIDLFNCINAHTQMLITQERQLVVTANPDPTIKAELMDQLQQYEDMLTAANGNYAIARMGKGKTLFFQTILPLLNDKVKDSILNLLKKEPGEFPRSRVLTVHDHQMMGWVKMEVKRPERKLFDNQVKDEITMGTPLKAHFVETKKVELLLNGELLTDIQLINPFKQEFAEGEPIHVVIHQMSKEGRIIQVKIN